MAPLAGPYEGYGEFLEGVRNIPPLPVSTWRLFHVRLNHLVTGTPRSMVSVRSRVPLVHGSVCPQLQTQTILDRHSILNPGDGFGYSTCDADKAWGRAGW
jgi:hypothetical protein